MQNDTQTPESSTPTRRTVVSLAVGLAGACAAGSLLASSADAAPGGDGGGGGGGGGKAPKGQLPTSPVDLGPLTDYAKEAVYDKFAKSKNLLVHRTADRLVVMSAVCTHKRCTIVIEADQLKCPCHSSLFNLDGGRTEGPAKTSLPHLAVSLKDGHIIADPKKLFEEKQWDDAGAFLDLKPAGGK